MWVMLGEFLVGEPFPSTVMDLFQTIVESILGWLEIERRPHDFHGLARADEWAGNEVEIADIGKSLGDGAAVPSGLTAAPVVQRNIPMTLEPAYGIPVGFSVADEDDGDMRHRLSRRAISR